MSQKHRNKNRILRMAHGAILASLATVLLVVGGVFELLDMTCAALSSIVILVAVVEFGTKYSLVIYAVSSVLSFVFLPVASSTWYFVFVAGYFPALKKLCDAKIKSRLLAFVPKFAVFNISVSVIFAIFAKIYGLEAILSEFSAFGLSNHAVFAVLYGVLNLFLLVYDMFLDRIELIYTYIFRKSRAEKKNF